MLDDAPGGGGENVFLTFDSCLLILAFALR
jgi:hypothetical protein